MHTIQYPIYEYCDKRTIDKFFSCIQASDWNNAQFFKIIKWFLDTLSNAKQERIFNHDLGFADTRLLVSTAIEFAFFAEKFDDNKNVTAMNQDRKENADDDGCNFTYGGYFKDLSKVNYIFKCITDLNHNVQYSRKTNRNSNDSTKKIVISGDDRLHETDEFWRKYKEFVLYLLFGNYKGTPLSDYIIQERCHIVNLLRQCLTANDQNISNDYWYKYHYNYIAEFKKCLNYLQKFLMQSINIGSSAYYIYCRYMNQEFAAFSQRQCLNDTLPYDNTLMDVIVLAIDLPKNEDDCKHLFECIHMRNDLYTIAN